MIDRLLLPPLVLTVTLAAASASAQTLFTENWDDGQGATRWSGPLVTLETPSLGWDGAVDYAFDYSVLGAPPAPGSLGGSTTGVFLESNTTDQTLGDEGESVGVVPLGFDLPDTNYVLTAQVYLFWNLETAGSTEYATLGVHHQRSANIPTTFGINDGDGIAWQVDSDGDGGSRGVMRFESPGPGETRVATYSDFPDGTIPGVPTGGLSPVGPFNQWVELSITSEAGEIEFAMNGYVFETYTNAGAFTGGTLLLAHSDPFNSVSPDNGAGLSNGVVFDNVTVTAVTPRLTGDYNGNGVVDAADYTVWRDTLGDDDFEPGTGADGDDDGFVSLLDYDVWADNFGDTAATATVVPEPVGGLLAMVVAAGLFQRR
ncbi:MAG: hypothetical protein AAF805_07250 [Planctomycetota bacterium]